MVMKPMSGPALKALDRFNHAAPTYIQVYHQSTLQVWPRDGDRASSRGDFNLQLALFNRLFTCNANSAPRAQSCALQSCLGSRSARPSLRLSRTGRMLQREAGP